MKENYLPLTVDRHIYISKTLKSTGRKKTPKYLCKCFSGLFVTAQNQNVAFLRKARSTSKIMKQKEKIKLRRSWHGEEQVMKNSCKDGKADRAKEHTRGKNALKVPLKNTHFSK